MSMPSNTTASAIPVADVRFVKELYPRLKPHDDVVERYRDALDHRWQAHVREGVETIQAIKPRVVLLAADLARQLVRHICESVASVGSVRGQPVGWVGPATTTGLGG